MLLLIRNERELSLTLGLLTPVIHADYPTLLTHLLHYPSPSTTYPFKPSLILTQARLLQSNVSSASGAEVVMENHELLGIKASGPDADASADPDASSNSFLFGRGATPSPRPGSATRGKARAGVQGLAQGLFERAQKAGLDKAFMSTVNDLRVRALHDPGPADTCRATFPTALRRTRSSRVSRRRTRPLFPVQDASRGRTLPFRRQRPRFPDPCSTRSRATTRRLSHLRSRCLMPSGSSPRYASPCWAWARR